MNPAIHMANNVTDRQIPKYLLTRKEAAWSLGISIRTLDTMSARGEQKRVAVAHKTAQ